MDARQEAREAVARVSRDLAHHGLLIGTAGNVSTWFAGPSGDEVAVTGTGVVLGTATADDVTVVDLHGTVLDGTLEPTSELQFHLETARERRGALVHTHSPIATAVSLVVDEVPCVHYQQLLLGGSIRVAPFAVFGSSELADNVRRALVGKQAAILANHGTVAWGADLAQAAHNALLLEWAAEMYWRAKTIGEPRALTDQQQQAVIEAAIATGYGTTKKVTP